MSEKSPLFSIKKTNRFLKTSKGAGETTQSAWHSSCKLRGLSSIPTTYVLMFYKLCIVAQACHPSAKCAFCPACAHRHTYMRTHIHTRARAQMTLQRRQYRQSVCRMLSTNGHQGNFIGITCRHHFMTTPVTAR